jgi:hypothetical protein
MSTGRNSILWPKFELPIWHPSITVVAAAEGKKVEESRQEALSTYEDACEDALAASTNLAQAMMRFCEARRVLDEKERLERAAFRKLREIRLKGDV